MRKGTPDKDEAISLVKKAIKRIEYVKKQKIDDESASFIFEDIYEAIRELSQSLMSLKGYKPYSHEALIAFIKEFYKFSNHEISTFDRYRVLRNNCTYRGAVISAIICKEALEFLEKFFPKLKNEFDEEIEK